MLCSQYPKDVCENAELTYTISTTVKALCADGDKYNAVTYKGYYCDDGKKIRWDAMVNAEYTGPLTCRWARGANNAVWEATFVGACGVAPSAVPDLPTSPNAQGVKQCKPAPTLPDVPPPSYPNDCNADVTFTLTTQLSDLCAVGDKYKIGRAVQQECRDRSRMPSSA
eukprot:TRINITY_DN7254_c0_g1_i13.p1 TRINITY_DN7254_c0_g1~~TRINITY_DN7254_c0_g1_i13.p1  ORF type:complete len:168 (-),score=27.60 TRINITY_DN7254_c0_g1_i13:19-522(-)